MDIGLDKLKKKWSAEDLKKSFHLKEVYTWERDTVLWHWSVDTILESCHLTTVQKQVYTDCIRCGSISSLV